MIKGLIFDFAGVITQEDAYWGWIGDRVKDLEAKRSIFQKLSEDVDSAAISHKEFIDGLADAAGASRETVWPEIKKRFSLNEELLDDIAFLKRFYKTGILSNFTDPWISELLEEYGVCKHFDEILISSSEKMIKPDPRFYHKILKVLNLQPEEAIFFDDKERNVSGAQKIGMQAFLFTTNEKFKADMESVGIFIK